jgi:hypothetical protein
VKNIFLKIVVFFICCTVILSSCSAIESIFKAGIGVGIFIVFAIIAIVVFVVIRFGKKNK